MELRRPGFSLRPLAERLLRTLLLWMSRRRFVGRLATATPITRPLVARFVAGETLAAALPVLQRMHDAGFHSTVDILGESVSTPEAATVAADAYLHALDGLAREGLDRNVSVKLSQMGLRIDTEMCHANVERIVGHAAQLGGFVRIDMEDSSTTDRTLALHADLFERHGNVGVVIQAALHRSTDDVEDLIRRHVRVRLCKGAYNEPPSVAFASKADVDEHYATLMERLLVAGNYPAIATHDERLLRRATAFAKREGVARDRFEFQMLYGVRRDLQDRLVRAGYAVRVYVPFGNEWYPYFMRRMAERPANLAFVFRNLLREGPRGPS
jgi:proline dehydrogenase